MFQGRIQQKKLELNVRGSSRELNVITITALSPTPPPRGGAINELKQPFEMLKDARRRRRKKKDSPDLLKIGKGPPQNSSWLISLVPLEPPREEPRGGRRRRKRGVICDGMNVEGKQ